MAFNFSDYLVIGISSRALFDLNKENEIFETDGLEKYSTFQLANETTILQPGLAFSLVNGILRLNGISKGKRKAEVIIMSRNSPDTSLRIFNSISHYKMDITRAALTSGASIVPYLNAFKIDLFLSANEEDVQDAVNAGIAAGLIYKSDKSYEAEPLKEIRIAFDGDAVIFSDESEGIYKKHGLEAFLLHEKENAENPMAEGPFAKLLKTLAYLQSEFGPTDKPIRTALVTARNSPAHERVIRTLRAWGVRIDEAFFMGGASKEDILKAFGAHIFFDDQEIHLSKEIPSARVPYVEKLED